MKNQLGSYDEIFFTFFFDIVDEIENRFWVPSLGQYTLKPADMATCFCSNQGDFLIFTNSIDRKSFKSNHRIIFGCQDQSLCLKFLYLIVFYFEVIKQFI
jgi:hypothetical protein